MKALQIIIAPPWKFRAVFRISDTIDLLCRCCCNFNISPVIAYVSKLHYSRRINNFLDVTENALFSSSASQNLMEITNACLCTLCNWKDSRIDWGRSNRCAFYGVSPAGPSIKWSYKTMLNVRKGLIVIFTALGSHVYIRATNGELNAYSERG